jgi:hypothetical protein
VVATNILLSPHGLQIQTFTIENEKHLENNSVVPDGVTGPETNPLRNRTVLLLGFGKLLLGAEGLLGLFFMNSLAPHHHENNQKQNIAIFSA